MALPHTVRVKLSSEAAEAISLTPVVVQELPIRELLEHVLGVTGKDEARIGELLLRGSLVSGASRFRWQGWEPDREAVRELLGTFPDPDPSRAFAAANCARVVLRGGRQPIDLPREVASSKGLFQRRTFWDVLMEVASREAAGYAGYSYKERRDRYLRELTHADAEQLRAAADGVRYSTVRDQIRTTPFSQMELFVER
jgi:hypothetical protein